MLPYLTQVQHGVMLAANKIRRERAAEIAQESPAYEQAHLMEGYDQEIHRQRTGGTITRKA